jgi:hypothetical protein
VESKETECRKQIGSPMEQNVYDSSKYRVSLLSIDSRFADVRSCENSEFKITLPYQLKNVQRIRMASIELPLVEYEYSEEYGNLTCAVKIGNATTFTKVPPIPAGNYTAETLTEKVQTNLQIIHSGFRVELDSISGRIRIFNTAIKFQFYGISFNKTIARQLSYWGLGYYLGFRNGTECAAEDPLTGNWVIEASSILSLTSNNYYLLQLWAPDAVVNLNHRLEEQGFLEAFAKIILKDGSFTQIFDDNQNLLRKEYTFLAPTSIPFIKVALLNGYGRPVNMLNMNWSLTFEVTEVVNSKVYTQLNQTYNRL